MCTCVIDGCVCNVQVLVSTVALSGDKVSSGAQDPVQGEAATFETLVCVVCGFLAVTPVLDVELLAAGEREEGRDCGEDVLKRNHLEAVSGVSRGGGVSVVAFRCFL